MRSDEFAEPRSDAYLHLRRKKDDRENNVGWMVLLFSAIRKAVAGEAEHSRPWERKRHPALIPNTCFDNNLLALRGEQTMAQSIRYLTLSRLDCSPMLVQMTIALFPPAVNKKLGPTRA